MIFQWGEKYKWLFCRNTKTIYFQFSIYHLTTFLISEILSELLADYRIKSNLKKLSTGSVHAQTFQHLKSIILYS